MTKPTSLRSRFAARLMTASPTCFALCLLIPAATSASAQAALKPSPRAAQAAPKSEDRLLWDHWYTVTVNKSVRYEYFNDRVERKSGRIIFQNRAWKLEEHHINEEQLGVFALADPEFTPLFFNFHSNYRATETSIDGSVAAAGAGAGAKGKTLTVRVRKGSAELPLIRRGVPAKTFFSSHFPLWLGARLASFKTGQTYAFQAILEDNLEAGYAPVNGQVRLEAPDETARRLGASKLLVDYQGMKSYWWVESNGSALRIEMPAQKTVVERVTEAKAKAFLGGK